MLIVSSGETMMLLARLSLSFGTNELNLKLYRCGLLLSQLSAKTLRCDIIMCAFKMNLYLINTELCPIKVNSNTIEFTVHTSCYCI